MGISGRRIVVTGGTGHVGWGVAKAALEAGAQVIAPTRDVARAAELAESLGRPPGLTTIVGDLSDPTDALRLRDEIEAKHGPIDDFVASMGPWWQGGPVVEQSAETYRMVLRQSLDSHVFAAQAFLPVLRRRQGATYTIITGVGGEHTIPNAGFLVIAVGGVFALSRTLRSEHAGDAVRVNEVRISARVERETRPRATASIDFGRAMVAVVESPVRERLLSFSSLPTFLEKLAAEPKSTGRG